MKELGETTMEKIIEHNGFVRELPGIKHRLKMGKKNNQKPFVRSPITEQSRRILVVDDEKSIQEVLKALLTAMGYEVVSAGSGREGLHLFLENPIELVLTDLNMPGMDGFSFASHIKRKSPGTRVVLITGLEKGAVDENLKRGCIDSVLIKPFGLEDLQKTVQGMVG